MNEGTGTLVGYIRVSTKAQTHDQQRDRLTAAGVAAPNLYAEKVSGAARVRPEFDRMLAYVRPGDTILCTSLDRLGRNLVQVVTTVAELTARGITVRTLSESIDTSTITGQLLVGIFASLAQWERSLIAERAAYARAAASERGLHTGRPRKLSTADVRRARKLIAAGEGTREVARMLHVGKSTLYDALNRPETA